MNDWTISNPDSVMALEAPLCPCGKHRCHSVTISGNPDKSVCEKCYFDSAFELAEALQAKRVKEAQTPDTQEEVA